MDKNHLVIFTGRPNAGKSTCLKFLGRGIIPPRQLSKIRTGKRAGTTHRIVTLQISRRLTLVDFPGFGRIAKRSKKFTESSKDAIVTYIEKNASEIIMAIHLIDVSTFWKVYESLEKKGIENIDIEMVNFLLDIKIPEVMVLGNKVDKLSTSDRKLNEISELLPDGMEIIPVSFKTRFNAQKVKQRFKMIVRGAIGPKASNLIFKSG
ncbi:MAG: GTPase [Candidatus Hodarchaeales archaeon]|jgi:GTP-binding protein EngB required for normal cell division